MEIVTTVENLINDPNFNTDEYEGFVYIVTNLTNGRSYIGKKNFRHNQTKKLGKKEMAALPITRGRTATKKKIVKESDWKTYYGSSIEVKKAVKELGPENFTRVVVRLCKNKRELTYYECKLLFESGVLEPGSTYYNDNILGKFFKKDLE